MFKKGVAGPWIINHNKNCKKEEIEECIKEHIQNQDFVQKILEELCKKVKNIPAINSTALEILIDVTPRLEEYPDAVVDIAMNNMHTDQGRQF